MGYDPIKEETKELYLKIWTNYSIGHLTQSQLAKLFNCTVDTIANAIKWCAENRTQFRSSILAESAKESVEAKLRELGNDLVRLKEKETVNWNAVIGLERLILENRQILWKLQTVIQDKNMITINNVIDNNLVKKAKEELMEVSDDKRQQIITSLREIINRPDSVQEGSDGAAVADGESRI